MDQNRPLDASGSSFLRPFYFEIRCEEDVMWFQEVSGIDAGSVPLDEPSSERPNFSLHNPPPLSAQPKLTLKRGILRRTKFWDWVEMMHQGNLSGAIETRTMTLSLQDEEGLPAAVWTVHQAFPVRYTAAPLANASRDEFAVESIEFVYQSIVLQTR
ncbi:MAG: phage tail protein [Rhodothermales bacterium]